MADPQAVRMRRRRWPAAVLCALCVVALGGAMTACGEDEPDRDEPAVLDTARLGKITRLSAKQYQAFKVFYETGDEIARLDNTGLSIDIVFGPLTDVCEAFDTSDPLLAPLRTTCLRTLEFETVLADTLPCVGTDECADRYDDARTRLQTQLRADRAYDRAVKATRMPRACKRELDVDKKDYRQARRYDHALAALQASARTLPADDDAIAAKRLIREDRRSRSGPNPPTSTELKRLRRLCRRR